MKFGLIRFVKSPIIGTMFLCCTSVLRFLCFTTRSNFNCREMWLQDYYRV